MALSAHQLEAISIAERVGGSFSLVGCAFIATTYCSSKAFRKPVNRLIFYASFGNIFSAVATLMGRRGIIDGLESPLCITQAFFIQYWMPADSLWSFCMAMNIYLAFYRRYSARDLKKLEKWYLLFCYGLPLPLAIALSAIKTEARGRIYGPAVIWCSITRPWQFLRLVCFYGPVWAVSTVTFTIYVTVGSSLFRKHRSLQKAKKASPITRTVTADTTYAAGEALSLELTTTSYYSSCLESQQCQTGSGVDAQIHKTNALWSYLRYSFLFFIAMVVTWLPSSFNRIHTLAKPDSTNFGLNLSGALVLSLQGFWNAIIYFSTAYPTCKDLWHTNVTSRFHSRPRLLRRFTGRKTHGIQLESMAASDGREPSHAGRTSSLAIPPPLDPCLTEPSDVHLNN